MTVARPPTSSIEGAVGASIATLQAQYLGGIASARAALAELRRGLSHPVGSDPRIWALTVGSLPPALTGHDDEPTRAEVAAHTAITLYALHQQSLSQGMHRPGIGFGSAVATLRGHEARSEAAVTRRFLTVATAASPEELIFHVRGLIAQLRHAQIGFDYGRFAGDVMLLLMPGRENGVRLRWGRQFYRRADSSPATALDEQ